MIKNLMIVWLLITLVFMAKRINELQDEVDTVTLVSKSKLDYMRSQCRLLLDRCSN